MHVTMRIVSRVILARFPLSIESNGAVLLQHFFLFPVLIVLIVTTRATVVLTNTCNVMNVSYQFGKIWKMLKFLHNIYECCICVTHFGGGGGGGGLYCENDHKNVKILETINWFVEWTHQFQIWRYKIIWYLVRINRCRIQQLIYGSQLYLRSENFTHNDGSFNLDYTK